MSCPRTCSFASDGAVVLQSGESQKLQQLAHARKKLQAEYEAELQAVRLDVQNERSNSTLLRRQNDKLKLEVERLNGKLSA